MTDIHIYFLDLSVDGTKNKYCFLILFLNERNAGSLDKWLILGLGQEICKMILENKEALNKTKQNKIKHISKPQWFGVPKGHKGQQKEFPMVEAKASWAT